MLLSAKENAASRGNELTALPCQKKEVQTGMKQTDRRSVNGTSSVNIIPFYGSYVKQILVLLCCVHFQYMVKYG